jgi:hypothetical protein
MIVVDQEIQGLSSQQRNVINNAALVDISDGSPSEAERSTLFQVGERDSIRETVLLGPPSPTFVHHTLSLLEPTPVVPPPSFLCLAFTAVVTQNKLTCWTPTSLLSSDSNAPALIV